MFCLYCRRERQFSVGNNEESPGNYEVLNFSTSGAGQLTVHKGKCLGKQRQLQFDIPFWWGENCTDRYKVARAERRLLCKMECRSQKR